MATQDICGVDVQALYLNDPGNKQEPAGYALCSDMGNTCMKNGCSCRSSNSATVNGTTKYFGVCIVLKKGADCVTSGDDYITCATGSVSTGTGSAMLPASTPEAQNESGTIASAATPAPNTKATTESKSTTASRSASSSGDIVSVASTAAAHDSMSTTVMVIIIIVAVIFVALVSWVVRSYCMRRSTAQGKFASRRNRSNHGTDYDATSPTNVTGRSSATPSFPAFDRRARAAQSPTAGDRRRDEARSGRGNPDMPRGRNTPRAANREPTSARGPEIDFGPREPKSGRGLKPTDLQLAIDMKREPKSGRGLKPQDLMASVPAPILREPTSGHGGRRSPEQQREPVSAHGRRDPDMQYGPASGAVRPPRGVRDTSSSAAEAPEAH
ncbi:unnamed protein product [Phytophthora fragariaefolia]|uniref:Unnamed protein product n=1 Tax=Phytophthora fragariaefolia TaxID=1490495 RepID=A0A9W6U467_9STRA|nr:unnamed protein product [Phytophthora fragariaefolia]